MAKIKVKNAVVALEGHEMTRIIGQWIRGKLIPYCTRKGIWGAVQNRHMPT